MVAMTNLKTHQLKNANLRNVRSFLVRKRSFIIASVIVCLNTLAASAQYRIVIDPQTISAVIQNTASQKAIEDQHNKRLDSIASKKQKIEQFTATMATITEAYKVTMENVKGFGTESKYYIEIGLCAYDIVERFPRLYKAISNAGLPGKAQSLMEITNLYARTQQLVGDFVNIVNNAKVESPLRNADVAKVKDGYNFLDRYDRLTVANRILTDLTQIRYKLEYIETLAHYANWNSLFYSVDPKGWATMMSGKARVDLIISQWKGLK